MTRKRYGTGPFQLAATCRYTALGRGPNTLSASSKYATGTRPTRPNRAYYVVSKNHMI
jgi:hypothetical protein